MKQLLNFAFSQELLTAALIHLIRAEEGISDD
jgi:hypothetical protein